jgi:P4 family phage/plasmid primase-like protien
MISPDPSTGSEVVDAPSLSAELLRALDAAQAEGLEPNVRRWLRFQGATAGEWIEAQALAVPDGKWTSNKFAHAGDAATLVKLLAQADTWNAPGIYVIASRIDPAVATRKPAGAWHVAPKGEGTSDRDVRARAAFYIDIDVDRPKGTSATDAQVLAAHERAVRVYAHLAELLGGRASLAFGHSGNGRALFVALDFPPETPELRALVGGLLAALRAIYQGDGIKIDVSVAEAKRLVPAFGTTKRKGARNLAEYPHRRTAILTPAKVVRVGQPALEQLLHALLRQLDDAQRADVDKAMGKKAARPTKLGSRSQEGPSPFDLAKEIPIGDVLAWLDLVSGVDPICPGCGLSGDSSVAVVGNGLKCSHDRCAAKGVPGAPGFRTTIDVVMEARGVEAKEAVALMAERFGIDATRARPKGPTPRRVAAQRASAPSGGNVTPAPALALADGSTAPTEGPPDGEPPLAARRGLLPGTDEESDLANAERFIGLFGQQVRWNAELGGWHGYDTRRWGRDIALVEQWAQFTARQLLLDAGAAREAAKKLLAQLTDSGDEEGAKRAAARLATANRRAEWAKRSQSAAGLAAMLRTAQCQRTVRPKEFDVDPWLFNATNGTVDLQTGVLGAHRREDMITKITRVAYDADAACPRWLAFLEQVQPDEEVRGFLRRLIGYSLTGLVREHILPINYGVGRNGKGVFMNTLLRVIGDYGTAVPPELLMTKRGDSHPTERTVLFGARLASAQETEEGRTLNVAQVKTLTGGDPIKARRMREDFWEFEPTHKLWLSTNHKPQITETKNAIWSRVYLIPWTVALPPKRQNYKLLDTLVAEEGSGILAWAVAACLEYQREGLAPPSSVIAVTQTYREQQDALGAFLEERCLFAPDERVTRSELRAAYLEWVNQNGIDPEERLSSEGLASKLREHGIEDMKSVRHAATRMPDRGWRGLRLKTRAERYVDGEAAEQALVRVEDDDERAAIQSESEVSPWPEPERGSLPC